MDSEIDPKDSGTNPLADPIRFGECMLDPASHRLWRLGAPVHLPRLPFDVLWHLIEQRPRLVTRDVLLERFWRNNPGGDQALTRCMSTVRKALGDDVDPPRCIETRHGVGYRFIAEVVSSSTEGSGASPAAVAAVPAAQASPAPQAPSGRWLAYVLAAAAAVLVLVVALMAWTHFEVERAVSAGAEAILARERSGADLPALRSQFERMPRAKLLWVDDHPEGNRSEREAFTHAGLVVDIAHSNAEAAERMRGREYDLIISDIGRDAPQPPRAGLDLPRELLPDRNRVPPIIYYVERMQVERTVDGYPVTSRPSELFRLTSELLATRGAMPVPVPAAN